MALNIKLFDYLFKEICLCTLLPELFFRFLIAILQLLVCCQMHPFTRLLIALL